MPRMIELIQASAVPPDIMQSAAQGELALPGEELIEILVYIADHTPDFSETARAALANWDFDSLRRVSCDPNACKEVLDYLIAPQNARTDLLPTLLENLSIADDRVAELAATASDETLGVMLKSGRVNQSIAVLTAVLNNPHLGAVEAEAVRARLVPLKEAQEEAIPDVFDEEFNAYLAAHADEILAEGDKPFQPIGGMYEDILGLDEPETEATGGVAAAKKATKEVRGGALKKISKMDVKGRIQLAMKGSKEERSILIRDGTKIVALAVLDSPKITDSEVEGFASQKNVLEAVLRAIPLKRRFIKQYPIVRNLVFNPRTPLDVSLTLVKNLLVNDLRILSTSKEVSETVRKVALRSFKQKKETGKKE